MQDLHVVNAHDIKDMGVHWRLCVSRLNVFMYSNGSIYVALVLRVSRRKRKYMRALITKTDFKNYFALYCISTEVTRSIN